MEIIYVKLLIFMIVIILSVQIIISGIGYQPYIIELLSGKKRWNKYYDNYRLYFVGVILFFSIISIITSFQYKPNLLNDIALVFLLIFNVATTIFLKFYVWGKDFEKIESKKNKHVEPTPRAKNQVPIKKAESLALNTLNREEKRESFKELFNNDLFDRLMSELIKHEVVNEDGKWNRAGLISDKKYLCVLLFKLEKLKIIKMKGGKGYRLELFSAFILNDEEKEIQDSEMSNTRKSFKSYFEKLAKKEKASKSPYQEVYEKLDFLNKYKL